MDNRNGGPEHAWKGRTVVLCSGVAGRVVLACRSFVTVLGIDGTLFSCDFKNIVCVIGGMPSFMPG